MIPRKDAEAQLIRTGCDILADNSCHSLRGRKVGLLANHASVSSDLTHITEILSRNRIDLSCIFGPQHGFRGDTQANMVEWEGYIHPEFNIPVHSLYGKTRRPSPESLAGLDIMILDLPDVGARPYTYIWTALCMLEECSKAGIEVLVLDRPNPLGGSVVVGPLLREEFLSFVGMYPFPVRHALTIGEALQMINLSSGLQSDLEVKKLDGWKREMYFDRTGQPWVMPSPNIPTLETAIVYPGMVLLEATNISEGRGTTRPFEMTGAPWIEPKKLLSALKNHDLEGVVFRPIDFSPAWDKYSGRICRGVQLHITDRDRFMPLRTAAILIKSISDIFPDAFEWLAPPYEYEERHMPIDILSGSELLRNAIDSGQDIEELFQSWKSDEKDFLAVRKDHLLY